MGLVCCSMCYSAQVIEAHKDVDAWLNPDPKDLDSLHDILDARERLYYVHKVAS